MTAPERKTTLRSAMADDPHLEGIVMLMLDRLMPALEHVKDHGKVLYPDDDDLTECTVWMNGAIFGAVATYVMTNLDDAQLRDILKLYICIVYMIDNTVERYGCMNLDQHAQDFLDQHIGEMPEA